VIFSLILILVFIPSLFVSILQQNILSKDYYVFLLIHLRLRYLLYQKRIIIKFSNVIFLLLLLTIQESCFFIVQANLKLGFFSKIRNLIYIFWSSSFLGFTILTSNRTFRNLSIMFCLNMSVKCRI
jgi:hypothetical protein